MEVFRGCACERIGGAVLAKGPRAPWLCRAVEDRGGHEQGARHKACDASNRGRDAPDGVYHESRRPDVTASSMISFRQGQRQEQRVPVGLGEWFFWSNCPKLCPQLGREVCGTQPTARTASMTTRTLRLHWTACMSIGVLLGGTLWLHPLAAQSGARDDGTNAIIMSPPRENPQGSGGIDYKNAKPMPLPAVPGPPPSATLPALPSTGDRSRPPGSVPGRIGTGEQHPQVLMPPQPLPDTNPAQGQR